MISESNILNCFQHLVEDLENSNVILGSGDDAAVIKSNTKDLVHSLDISKVGTHFPEDSSPEDIAYRSVAVALSDLAAMGAYPSFISIGLSSNIKEIKWSKIGVEIRTLSGSSIPQMESFVCCKTGICGRGKEIPECEKISTSHQK